MEKVDKKSPIPRYYQAQEKIESLIKDNYYKPGDKLMPERELAPKLGISRITVKRAISELVAKKILYQEWGKGTFVNKKPKLKSSTKVKNLGITIWEGAGIGHPVTAEISKGIKDYIKDKNYNLKLLFITEEIIKKHYTNKLIEEANIAGVLIRLAEFKKEDVEEIRKRNIPLVLLEPYETPDCPSVTFDYAKVSYETCEYLIKLGHKKIALINGPKDFFISRQALGGYKKALRKYSLGSEDKMVRHGYYSEDTGYKLVKELLKISFPTAVITADDMMAAGAMKAIKEKGLKIPEDISIIGYNDMPIASYLDPPLTTMK